MFVYSRSVLPCSSENTSIPVLSSVNPSAERARRPGRDALSLLRVLTLLLVSAVASATSEDAAVYHGVGRSLSNTQTSGPMPPGASRMSSDRRQLSTEAPESEKRPFTVAYYYDFGPVEDPVLVSHVQDELMPAVASLLGRWLRVRVTYMRAPQCCASHEVHVYV